MNGQKILIIEDETSLRKNIAEILTFEGFSVLEAVDGEKGLEMVRLHNPGLVLCDVMMPGKNGYEVLEAMRKAEQSRLIPVIMVTAMAERENVRTGMNLGADDYLIKPFTRVELLNSINSRLSKSEQIDEYTKSSLDELRSVIIRTLPHELRTPLNGIIGFGELLMNNPEMFGKNEISEMGKSIHNSGMRLYRLVQNYLLYAQLELQNSDFTLGYTENASAVCRQTTERIAGKYQRMDDLKFQGEICPVACGSDELEKIVGELTDNAFRFSNPGEEVTVSCHLGKDRFHFTITDRSTGISEENIRKMGAFMQFDRVFREQQGSGLGLAIVRKLTELHQGELTIKSNSGKGTIVTVELPC